MPFWKKSDPKKGVSGPPPPAVTRTEPKSDPPVSGVRSDMFCLGKACKLKGELTASIDVEIRGEVEGKIELDESTLTVADGGCVTADITAREVVVRGDVVGNVSASGRIVVEPSGSVLGDICAPSIQLRDGSRFTGSINRDALPAKVSGRLNGDSGPVDESGTEQSEALTRRQNPAERRGSDRPWGATSNRRSPSGAPEPTTTA